MLAKFSAERPHPLCRLAAGTYQLRNTFLGIRLSCVGGKTVCTLLVKAAYLRKTRKTQSGVNDGYALRYICKFSSDLQTLHTEGRGNLRHASVTCSTQSRKHGDAVRRYRSVT